MRVLSLFDGISCGQVALERAGIPISIYMSSEIDAKAIQVTQHNYPSTIQLGDVTELDGTTLGDIDLLLAGSPCQGFSFAGQLLGLADPRSKLFFEFYRILQETHPQFWLLENVGMSEDNQSTITNFLGVSPVIINSSLVSAQQRKRLYWTNIPIHRMPIDRGLVLGDILEDAVADKYDITKRFCAKRVGTLAYTKAHANLRYVHQKSRTLMTGGHGISNTGSTNLWIAGVGIRIPTPRECERLQTLPDDYTDVGLPDSARYALIGNGWTVDVIAHILSGIPLDKETSPMIK